MAYFKFNGVLVELLKDRKQAPGFELRMTRRASVKDVIESLGPPHTEIGKILKNSREAGFGEAVTNKDIYEIFPITAPFRVLEASFLRPVPLSSLSFVADVNVGKLGILLRLLGFDTLSAGGLSDEQIAYTAKNQGRILLTKDTRLLKRKNVEFGRLVRGITPDVQIREAVEFFGLSDMLQPFIRCSVCNGLLEEAEKSAVLDRLLPLTRIYYDRFNICLSCNKIYWRGTHHQKMESFFRKAGINLSDA